MEMSVPGMKKGMSTRRQVIRSAAVALGGLGMGAAGWAAASSSAVALDGQDVSHSAEAIHQEVVFKASRKRVYEALTETKEFDKVVRLIAAMQPSMPPGAKPTEISREVGGAFVVFGGHIFGRHLELVPGERIVQAWRVEDWPVGVYSIARFELAEQGIATKIIFDHTGFPKDLGEHLAEGWRLNYWEPLAKLLAKS